MGLFDGIYRTGAAMTNQGANLVGIKGGKDGWVGGGGLAMGSGGMGVMKAFSEGGFIGAGSQMKSFFGFGYDPTSMVETSKGMSLMRENRYLKTVGGQFSSQGKYRQALVAKKFGASLSGDAMHRAMQPATRFAHETAPGVFRRRKWAGGIAGGAGLLAAGQFVGYGNMMKMGAGWGVGSVLGGAAAAPFGASSGRAGASRAGYGAAGRRWGGRIGLAATGLGVMTGII